MNDEGESLDTWLVDETVNEDFDFGEGNTQTHPIKIKPLSKYNKKMIGFTFAIIIIFILIMLCSIYSYKLLASKNTHHKTELAETSIPTETTTLIPKNIKEASEDIKKQSGEFGSDVSDPMSSTPIVPAPVSAEPKSTLVSVPTPIDTPTLAVLNTPAAAKNRFSEKIEAPKLNRHLNELNNQIDSILNQIKYLDAYSREVSDNLNKLNTSLNAMDNRLGVLIASSATLSQEVDAVKSETEQMRVLLRENGLDTESAFLPKTKQQSNEKATPIAIAEPEYKVHAVVPGRAWLKSTKGQMITVTEGDSIAYYGKVLVINATDGVVLTSSGVVFGS